MNLEQRQRFWYDHSLDRRERIGHDLPWFVLASWYSGATDVVLDHTSAESTILRQRMSESVRTRRTRPLNLVGHATDIRVAKQMKARPVFDARPSSKDQQDVARARAARDWLRWFWVRTKLTSRRRRLYTDRSVTGNGFIKIFFDDHIGPYLPVSNQCETCAGTGRVMQMAPEANEETMEGALDGELVNTAMPVTCKDCDGAGRRLAGQRRQGDVSLAIVSPWEIYPAAGSTSRDTAPYITHAYPITRAVAAARYGIDASKIQPSAYLEEGDSHFAALARQNRITPVDQQTVYVLERYWTPVGSPYPRIQILCGDTPVFPRPDTEEYEDGIGMLMPEPYDELPILHFTDRPLPGQFFAMSRMLDAISSNDTVNRGRHNLHRHIQLAAYVKWIVEKSTVSAGQITNEENEIIEYRGINKPTQASPAPMPEYVRLTIEDEARRLYEVMGVTELDRGIAPPNIEAAEAFNVMVEQSETSNVPMLLEDQENFQTMGKLGIICAIANYADDEQRIVRAIGQGGRSEARALAKADLDGNVDITVELGGAGSQSLALRRADVLAATAAGVLPADRALDLMEFGVMGGEWGDDTRLHENDAMDENDTILGGGQHQMVPGLDDHAVHARVHRRQAHVERQSGNTDGMMALVNAALEHEQALAQMQQPAQPGGAPPQGGAAPPVPGVQAGTPFDNAPLGVGENTTGEPQA